LATAATARVVTTLMILGAVARASSPDGGRATGLDLELHEAFTAAPPRPSPGATLAPPRSSGATPLSKRYPLGATPDGGYLYQGPSFDARIARDGGVTFSSAGAPFVRLPDTRAPGRDPTMGGDPAAAGGGPTLRFDVTDAYLRRLRKDPARDAKAAFLSGTFDLRMNMALAAKDNLRRAALARLHARLDELWSDPGLTASQRRKILQATWEGLGRDDDAARAIVRDFARRHLSPARAAAFH
jgi:hypothetical protein